MPSVEKFAKANIGLMVILLVIGCSCFGFAYINALTEPRSLLRRAFSGASFIWIIAASIVGFVASGKKTRKLILAHFWLLFLLSLWIFGTFVAYIALVYNDIDGAKQDCIDAGITDMFRCNAARTRNHGIFAGISVIVLAGTLSFSIVSACWWRAAKYAQWDKIADREEKKRAALNEDQDLDVSVKKSTSGIEGLKEVEASSSAEEDSSSDDSDSSYEEEEEEEIDESARLESSKEMN